MGCLLFQLSRNRFKNSSLSGINKLLNLNLNKLVGDDLINISNNSLGSNKLTTEMNNSSKYWHLINIFSNSVIFHL